MGADGKNNTDREKSLHDTPVVEETFERILSLYGRQVSHSAHLAKIALKPGWTVVMGTDGLCGTAFRFSGPHGVYGDQPVQPEDLRPLVGRPLADVAAECLASPLMLFRSIAVACMSALSQPFLDTGSLEKRGLAIMEGRNIIRESVGLDDVVTLIGYGGMVQDLLGKCRELHIADMRPPDSFLSTVIGETIEYEPREVIVHGAEDDGSIIAKSDVVVITASTLVNGTIDDLLYFCANARVVGLYGASGSLVPDVLFERGIDFVMSHHVQDPVRFAESVRMDMNMEGALRQFQRHQTVLPGASASRRA